MNLLFSFHRNLCKKDLARIQYSVDDFDSWFDNLVPGLDDQAKSKCIRNVFYAYSLPFSDCCGNLASSLNTLCNIYMSRSVGIDEIGKLVLS